MFIVFPFELSKLSCRLVPFVRAAHEAAGGEVRLQGGNRQRLPESSRTRHEEEFSVAIRDNAMNVHRLVYVDFPVPAQRRKIGRVSGYGPHR
jgi:hypothetical protein